MGFSMVQIADAGERINRSKKVFRDRNALILFVALCGIWIFAEEIRNLFEILFRTFF